MKGKVLKILTKSAEKNFLLKSTHSLHSLPSAFAPARNLRTVFASPSTDVLIKTNRTLTLISKNMFATVLALCFGGKTPCKKLAGLHPKQGNLCSSL
jgi:hypothetical protein